MFLKLLDIMVLIFLLMVHGATGDTTNALPAPAGVQPIDTMTSLLPQPMVETASLSQLLTKVVKEKLLECDLVVAVDGGAPHSWQDAMYHLLQLPNPRQVVQVRRPADLLLVTRSSRCRGYLLLLQDPEPLITLAKATPPTWDYDDRMVVVGVTKDQLKELTLTKAGRKMEHIVGLVKADRTGVWYVFINQLFSGEQVAYVNTWHQYGFTADTDLFPDKLIDFGGAPLRMVAFEFPPSVCYRRGPDGSIVHLYGWDVEVVRALSIFFNFTMQHVEPPSDELWGVRFPNGSWNGMVGLFMNGLADIGITNVFITIDRMDFMDFSAPFDTDRSCFITRVEPPLPRWLSLALPYQMVTWMALLGGLLTTSLFLYLLTRVLLDRNLGELDTSKTLPYSGLYVLGMHFRVSQSHTPVRTSTQVFVLFLWLYVIIITTGYSSNLTAFLTVTREPTGMETLRELYISKLPVLSNGNFFKSVMVNTKNFYVQELAKNYRAEYDMDKTHSTVQQGKGVSIQGLAFQEYVIATRYTTHGRPSIRIMKECFSDHSIALGLEKQSVLERKFNKVLNWIVEAGLVRRWFLDSLNLALEYARQDKKAKGNNGNTEEEDDDDDMMVRGTTARSIPLGIDHMQGIFFILVLLYSLSILVFLLEWLLA